MQSHADMQSEISLGKSCHIYLQRDLKFACFHNQVHAIHQIKEYQFALRFNLQILRVAFMHFLDPAAYCKNSSYKLN